MPFLDNYQLNENPPFHGGQGDVFLAVDIESQQSVAIKRIYSPDGEFSKNMVREMNFLLEIKHPCIVSLLSMKYEDPYLYLVTPEMPYTLKSHQSANPKSYPELSKGLMKNLLEGLAMLHERDVMHRDIKPENLLISESSTLQICDFGHARARLNPSLTPDLVTINYRAPELLLGDAKYTCGVDIWAAGCVFAEMTMVKEQPDDTDNLPFPDFLSDEDEEPTEPPDFGEDEFVVVNYDPLFGQGDTTSVKELLSDIFRLVGTPTEETWPGVTSLPNWDRKFEKHNGEDMNERFSVLGDDGVDLLKKMLQLNPTERITASAALQHPYFVQN